MAKAIVYPTVVWLPVPGRPVSINSFASLNYHRRNEHTQTIRESAAWVAKDAMAKNVLPRHADRIGIIVRTFMKLTRSKQLQDTMNAYPSIKPAIDGAVQDSGLCVDDSPAHVLWIVGMPPEPVDDLRLERVELGIHLDPLPLLDQFRSYHASH